MILNDVEIRGLIAQEQFIKGFISINDQLTPNGFDLTVEKASKFLTEGQIGFSNEERVLPQTKELLWENDAIELPKGCYKIRTNEIIKMPLDLIAIAMPRSSLLRSGVTISTGVWDAGFQGKSEFLLQVQNEQGFKLKKNARLVQLIFLRTKTVKAGYIGIFTSKT